MRKINDKLKKRSKTYVRIGMISASLILTAVPFNVQADVAAGMDAMWTSTAPELGAVNNNYGGSLGGISMRSPVRSFNILAYDPPRFSAGCGGIDAYLLRSRPEDARIAGEHAVQSLGVEPAPVAGTGRSMHLALQECLQTGPQGCGGSACLIQC